MAPASTSPAAEASPRQALAKSTLLGGVGDLDAAVSLRLHALFLPVPRLLLKALEVAGDGRIWLPVPISLLLISTTTSSAVSPLPSIREHPGCIGYAKKRTNPVASYEQSYGTNIDGGFFTFFMITFTGESGLKIGMVYKPRQRLVSSVSRKKTPQTISSYTVSMLVRSSITVSASRKFR